MIESSQSDSEAMARHRVDGEWERCITKKDSEAMLMFGGEGGV